MPQAASPQIQLYWTRRESGKVYQIVGRSADRITYRSVTDGQQFNLGYVAFSMKFRPTTPEELIAVENSSAAPVAPVPSTPAPVQPTLPRQEAPAPTINEQPVGDGPMVQMTARPGRRGQEVSEPGLLVETTEYDDFNRLILAETTTTAMEVAISKVTKRAMIEQIFRLSVIEPNTNRCVVNFHGEPGTGKTKAARALARKLGKKLYQVDYSEVISKYVGDTAKHIKQSFTRARELDAVLFFDEADSMCSRRIGMDDSSDGASATGINQNRNVLMQELDRFDGMVIMSTNHFRNFDPALVRRIAQHVCFELPGEEARISIYKLHFPSEERLMSIDWQIISKASEGFSGGDILNVAVNSIIRASLPEDPTTWFVTQDMILGEVASVKKAKEANAKLPRKKQPTMMPSPLAATLAKTLESMKHQVSEPPVPLTPIIPPALVPGV